MGCGLPQPIRSRGAELPSSSVWVSVLSGGVWCRKRDYLAKLRRRLAADAMGPEPVGTSTRIGLDAGLVGRGRQVASCPVSP